MATEGEPRPAGDSVRIRLFDADRTDRALSFDEALAMTPSERQLLWIDIQGPFGSDQGHRIRDSFELDAATLSALAQVAGPSGDGWSPEIGLHGRYVHVRVVAAPDPRRRGGVWLGIVGGPNLVITGHAEPLELLDAIDERIAADTTTGELDAADFIASVLDAVVISYRAAVDAIEDEVDVIDAKALGREEFGDLFRQLIDVRRRVGRLRRLLASHRELFAVLARGEFIHAARAADAAGLQAVAGRFEAALQGVEDARELVLGSFEILMTRTGQRTNDVMRLLTVATVLALPATIVAGFLGMNVQTPLPDKEPLSFWFVVVAILLVEGVILVVARLRRWI
jgi:Mg2+ and Co2+ transporter CorA